MTVKICQHVFTNGKCCNLPALRGTEYCYWHHSAARRARERENLGGPVSADANTGIDVPLLEDGNAIQISLQEVIHALLDRRIDTKRASLILYALQLAHSNNRNLLQDPTHQRHLVAVPDGEEIPALASKPKRPQKAAV